MKIEEVYDKQLQRLYYLLTNAYISEEVYKDLTMDITLSLDSIWTEQFKLKEKVSDSNC